MFGFLARLWLFGSPLVIRYDRKRAEERQCCDYAPQRSRANIPS
jgi:hypothetical protein